MHVYTQRSGKGVSSLKCLMADFVGLRYIQSKAAHPPNYRLDYFCQYWWLRRTSCLGRPTTKTLERSRPRTTV